MTLETAAGCFLRVTAATAVAYLSHRNSVCLSVCLSYRWISQKLCKLWSPNFHRQLLGRLSFEIHKAFL